MQSLAQIGWTIDSEMFLCTARGVRLHLIETNIEGLEIELEEAWIEFVAAKISGRQLRETMEQGGNIPKALRKGIRSLMQTLEGLDLEATVSLLKTLAAQDRGLLRAILTGAVRTEHEKSKCRKDEEEEDKGKCACGQIENSLDHRWRWCPLWKDARRPWQQHFESFNNLPKVTQSYGLVNLDAEEVDWRKSLWSIKKEGKAGTMWDHTPEPGSTGEAFLDGSARPADNSRFRTASWAVSNEAGDRLDAGQSSGRPQTINRAETESLLGAMRLFDRLRAWSDSAYVVRMFNAIVNKTCMKAWPLIKNGDLWKKVATMVQAREPDSVEVKKVKAHQEEHDEETAEEARLRKGNDGADRHAKDANGKERPDKVRQTGDRLMEKHAQKLETVRKYQQLVLAVSRRSVGESRAPGTKGMNRCVPQSMSEEKWRQDKCWKFILPILPTRQQGHWCWGKLTLERLRIYMESLIWADPEDPHEHDRSDPGCCWAVMAVDFELATGCDLPVNVGKGGKSDYRLRTECPQAAAQAVGLADLGLCMQGAVCQMRHFYKDPIIMAEDTRCSMRQWGLQ